MGSEMCIRDRQCTYQAKETQRAHFTHVAIVCDNTELQPLLPQVLIFNQKQLPLKRAAALRLLMPANVFIITQKSAWTNQQVHLRVLKLLGQVLEHFPQYQPILLQDGAPAHTSPEVTAGAYAAGLWPIMVPASTTWLLQPLDTHGFRTSIMWLSHGPKRETINLWETGILTKIGRFLTRACCAP